MHWRSATNSGDGQLGESVADIEKHHGRYIGIDAGDDGSPHGTRCRLYNWVVKCRCLGPLKNHTRASCEGFGGCLMALSGALHVPNS